jgi:hypothetical protein
MNSPPDWGRTVLSKGDVNLTVTSEQAPSLTVNQLGSD